MQLPLITRGYIATIHWSILTIYFLPALRWYSIQEEGWVLLVKSAKSLIHTTSHWFSSFSHFFLKSVKKKCLYEKHNTQSRVRIALLHKENTYSKSHMCYLDMCFLRSTFPLPSPLVFQKPVSVFRCTVKLMYYWSRSLELGENSPIGHAGGGVCMRAQTARRLKGL